jgi:ribose 5-phosphate isomerase B
MRIAFSCDHGGFPLKSEILDQIASDGHEVLDFGTFDLNSVDYPDFVEKACRAVLDGKAERAIIICGSGIGACITANKFPGIYAGICHDCYSAHQSVEHDNANVLCLGARVIGPSLAKEVVTAFLTATFSGEDRHMRRLDKMKKIEDKELR